MAEDPHNTSDISDPAEGDGVKEDAETSAARRELKQTYISEKVPGTQSSVDDEAKPDDEAQPDEDLDIADDDPARTKTPEGEASGPQGENLKEQISSPKKKRAHDQVDEHRESWDGRSQEDTSGKPANGSVTVSRTDRSEPEKKRPRDLVPEDTERQAEDVEVEDVPVKPGLAEPSEPKTAAVSGKDQVPQTSSSAFANSGFSKLAASSTSPFGALASGGPKTSIFSSGSAGSPSPFGALAGSKPSTTTTSTTTPTLSFGGTGKSGSSSPFAGLNGPPTTTGGGFGSTFGSGFGSALAGPRLTSFAKPGEVFKSDKPARPFGAPESDAEEHSEEGEEEEEAGENSGSEEVEKDEKERDGEKDDAKGGTPDDKKKPKLQKVIVDDGEAGETTILQVRAKMYQLEDKEIGWKERGAGMLKINVPESCVQFDEAGVPIPGSFDASGLECDDDDDDDDDDDEDSKGKRTVRLIMRQDHTLRVILNTAIVPATDFQERAALKASNILFTAFEGEEGKPVQMKMNHANAQAFLNEVELIKRELRGS